MSMCDTDQSGGCTLDEFGQVIVDNFQMIFDLIDLDGNGYLNFDDFVCDLDGNGSCDTYEIERFLNGAGFPSELNGFIRAGFKYIDTDEDGKITRADVEEWDRIDRNVRDDLGRSRS